MRKNSLCKPPAARVFPRFFGLQTKTRDGETWGSRWWEQHLAAMGGGNHVADLVLNEELRSLHALQFNGSSFQTCPQSSYSQRHGKERECPPRQGTLSSANNRRWATKEAQFDLMGRDCTVAGCADVPPPGRGANGSHLNPLGQISSSRTRGHSSLAVELSGTNPSCGPQVDLRRPSLISGRARRGSVVSSKKNSCSSQIEWSNRSHGKVQRCRKVCMQSFGVGLSTARSTNCMCTRITSPARLVSLTRSQNKIVSRSTYRD